MTSALNLESCGINSTAINIQLKRIHKIRFHENGAPSSILKETLFVRNTTYSAGHYPSSTSVSMEAERNESKQNNVVRQRPSNAAPALVTYSWEE